MKKISIVVPCYKVTDFLPQCVESLMNQTYKDIEILLVDDGSPDATGKLCDDYAKKDNRIKVVHKQNGGLVSARNAGYDVATGDWICMLMVMIGWILIVARLCLMPWQASPMLT